MLGNAPLSSTPLSDFGSFVVSSSGAITIAVVVAGISKVTPVTSAGSIVISIGVLGRLTAKSFSAAQITISINVLGRERPPTTRAAGLIQLFISVAGASRIVNPRGAGQIVVRITVLASGRALVNRPLPFDWQGSFSYSPWPTRPPPSSIGYTPYVQAISYSPETQRGYVAFRDGTAAVYVMSLSQFISLRFLVGTGADPSSFLATLQSVVHGNV